MVQTLVRKLESRKTDKARDIKRLSADAVVGELNRGPDPTFALQVWATSSKVVAEYPEEPETIGHQELDAFRRRIRRALERAYRAGYQAKARELAPTCDTDNASSYIEVVEVAEVQANEPIR
jgi:ribosome modulation factor